MCLNYYKYVFNLEYIKYNFTHHRVVGGKR